MATDNQANGVIKYGSNPATIKVKEAVKVGDALGFSDGWYRALATTGSGLIQMRCVAGEDARADQEITAYFGTVVVGGGRFSGATRGGKAYVAEGTDDGKYTETAPSTTGDANKIVGYFITATELVLNPNAVVDSVA